MKTSIEITLTPSDLKLVDNLRGKLSREEYLILLCSKAESLLLTRDLAVSGAANEQLDKAVTQPRLAYMGRP